MPALSSWVPPAARIYPLGLLALVVPVAAGAVRLVWFFHEGENHLDEMVRLKILFVGFLAALYHPPGDLGLIPTFTVTALLGWVAKPTDISNCEAFY